jgi:hypothetical protein
MPVEIIPRMSEDISAGKQIKNWPTDIDGDTHMAEEKLNNKKKEN